MNKITFTKTESIYENRIIAYGISMLIDGVNPSTDTFDPVEFVAATFKRQHSIPFTCSCGVPGCAGIEDGIYIKYRRHSVEWRDIDSKLDKSYYNFNITDYRAAQATCIRMMYEIIKENEEIKRDIISDDSSSEELFNYMKWDHYTNVPFASDSHLLSCITHRQNWLRNNSIL